MVRTSTDRGVATRMRRLTAAAAVLIGAVTGTVAFSSPALAQALCTPAALISAISVANSTNGTVTLTSGCTYTLTALNNTTDGGGVGLPVITGKVTIQGSGATIARSSATGTPTFRIFDVASAGSLTLNSVTIKNGLANNATQGGGGIYQPRHADRHRQHVHRQLRAVVDRHVGRRHQQQRHAEPVDQHVHR